MIIKTADVEGFGKFSNKSIKFGRGFNLILGGNEDGKTTFMAFIKMMFYSSSGKTEKGQDLLKILRKKYRPWNGLPMSGAVEFEKNGLEYRLHKEFLKSEASDKTTVFCKTTAEDAKIENPNEAGEYFFNMNLGEFERSVFIGNSGGFSSDASSDSLAMRISNLSVSGDENISKDVIIKRLSEALEELVSKSGKKGILVDAEAELDALRFELQKVLHRAKAQKSLFEEIAQLENDIAKNEEILKAIINREKIATAKKDLNAFYTLSNKINLRENINKQLSKYGKTISELKDHISRANRLEAEITQTLSALEEISSSDIEEVPASVFYRAEFLNISVSEIRSDLEFLRTKVLEEKTNFEIAAEKANKKSKAVAPAIFGIFAVLAIVFIAFGFATKYSVWNILGVSVVVLGTILSIVLARVMPKKATEKIAVQFAKRNYESALCSLKNFSEDMSGKTIAEIEGILNSQLSDSLSEFHDILDKHSCNNIDRLKEKTISAKNEQLTLITAKLNSQKEQFTLCLAELKPVDSFVGAKILFNEINDSLNTLSNVLTDIETISTAAGISDTSEAFVGEHIKALADFLQSTYEAEVLEENASEIEGRLRELRQKLGDCQRRINLPERTESDINSQIRDAESHRDELKSRFNELSIASDVMTEAIAEMNKGLGSHLSKKTGEYLSAMTNGRYSDVLVSRSLDVEARTAEGEVFHEWKYLSGAAIARIYLALRLAATDILAESDEPLPLFLDDILAQYDDENCKRTLNFLKDYLENNGSVSQILFFTCHSYIADIARSIFPNLHEISL